MLQQLALSHRAIQKLIICAKGRVDWSHLDSTRPHMADAVNSSRTHTATSKGHCAAPRRCVYATYLDAVTYPTDAETDTDNFALSESALPDLRHLYANRKIP